MSGSSGLPLGHSSTTGNDGRRCWLPPNVGRNRLRKDDRIPPPRARVRATGVDGATSTETDGESSDISASVLFDTFLVDIRFSDELPLPMPTPREKMDTRFGNVSAGDIASNSGFGDRPISPSSNKHTQT